MFWQGKGSYSLQAANKIEAVISKFFKYLSNACIYLIEICM